MAFYPKFTVKDLTKRCQYDIGNYFTKNNITEQIDYTDYSNIDLLLKKEGENTYEIINEKINTIKDKFSELTNTSNINFLNFNYSHDINKFDDVIKNKLWLLRTILLYQLSIVCVFMVQNNRLFDEIYKDKNSIIGDKKRNFTESVAVENYEMAIFGSMNASSDIDISIVYNGDSKSLKQGDLSYIISILEDLFLIFISGKKSLDFDIEFYASMLSAKNPNINNKDTPINSPDIYILDTSSFNQADFIELIPYASASILRNIYNHDKLTNNNDFNNTVIMEDIIKKITDFKYTHYKEILNATQSKIQETDRTYLNLDNTNSDNIDTNILKIFNNTDFETKFKEGLEKYKEYKVADYNTARNKYYVLINTAEEKFNKIKTIFDESNKTEPDWQIRLKQQLTENKQLILDAVKAIAQMDLFREESYVFVPSVMHVVRVLQLENINTEKGIRTKYPVTYPQCLYDKKQYELEGAVCEIGKYGYLLSILEQIGFILRFEKEYCGKNLDGNNTFETPKKCSDKILKYIKRYVDAITKIHEEEKNNTLENKQPDSPEGAPQILTGGKRRTHKKYKKRTTHKKKNRNPRKSKLYIKKSHKIHKK